MMSGDEELTRGVVDPQRDARLQEALGAFRSSVRAWSEATLPAARMFAMPAPHRLVWRRTLAWALGVSFTVGGASGALYERRHRQDLAQQAQQRERERERTLAVQRAAEMDELLAKVDSDVSREVPNALEPLAQMMTEGGGSK